MKRIISLLLAAVTLLAPLTLHGCGERTGGGEIKIVCTVFPQYDFARELLGGEGEITLLLPPGVESHSYDPTPSDILKILECDLFIYTGDEMEPWAAGILSGAGEHVRTLELSESVELICEDEHEEHGEHHHHHDYDPHIWTSPANALLMTNSIADTLEQMLPDKAEEIEERRLSYAEKLNDLDRELYELSEQAARRRLVFGGRFALLYMTERYGFDYMAAFDSCSHEAEPSARDIVEIIEVMDAEGIPVIYYEEMTDPKIARVIAGQTGAKMLLYHTCHNLSASDRAAGETYLSLMEQNIENLKEGLL